MKNLTPLGFTIVELMVAITVIAILMGFSFVVNRNLITKSQDNERRTDVATIAKYFERTYLNDVPSTGATYPGTADISNQDHMNYLLDDSNRDALVAPNQAAQSLIAATGTGAQNPTRDQYIYQPFTAAASPTLCQDRALTNCVRYVLWYRTEVDNQVHTLESRRQQ